MASCDWSGFKSERERDLSEFSLSPLHATQYINKTLAKKFYIRIIIYSFASFESYEEFVNLF